ncbi:leader peptidase [alpha proteobacterium U9-1i]|nr:leader peptidase [alpha proteobacterium U9-1i]
MDFAFGLFLSAPAAFGAVVAARAANDTPVNEAKVGVLFLTICAACAASAVAVASDALAAWKVGVLAAGLAYLAAFDARAMAIPVWPTILLIAAGLVWSSIDGVLVEHLSAALAGAAAFLILDAAYRRLRGRSGLGEGDALVAAALGAWLSFEGLAWSVALGGAAGALFQIFRGAARTDAMPFVPALAFGAAGYWIMLGRF